MSCLGFYPSRGLKIKISGHDGGQLKELLAQAMMEYRMSSYRAIMASTRAILSAEATDTSNTPALEDSLGQAGGGQTVGATVAEGVDHRYCRVLDLLRSEREYLQQIQYVLEQYAEPFRKFTSLSIDDHRVLFIGIEPIVSLSAMITSKLDDAVQTWDPASTKIGSLFTNKLWDHYRDYAERYPDIKSCLDEKYEHEDEFLEFCELRRGSDPNSLADLLYLPVQRIPEYDKYLNELLKVTGESHPDFKDLSHAAAKVRNMVKEREYEEGSMDHQKRMERVQRKFPDDDLQLRDLDDIQRRQLASRRKSAPGAVLLKQIGRSKSAGNLLSQNAVGKKELDLLQPTRSPCHFNRQYLMEGPVEFARGMQSQDRYLFLFSDLLLVAKQRSSTTFKLKQRIRVSELWISFCMDDVSEITRAAERSFVIGWPTTNVVATFKSTELKDTWLNKFNEQIEEERKKQLPKTLMLDVLNKEIDKPCSVEIENTTTTAELVKKCVDHFQILESEAKDYQLWVKVGHDEPPYPLIGHELPYSIKLSIVRDFAKKTDDELSESAVEQILAEMQSANRKYDFVLKHNRKSPKKQHMDEAAKSKKNKKSPLINLFRRQREEKKPAGKLFGHQLADITTPDMLIAKPVKELMTILFREGPYTVGILRKSPNARMCKELRQKLDDGEDSLNNESWPPLVIGALLKEFLRSIPQSLLMEEFFDDWVACNQVADGDEKIEKFRETVRKLPACHSELLRHLMCVLYHIDKKNDENKMNSYNLSVCIAPSLLWPKGNPDPLATPATIIQYMIEKYSEIFGEDSILLFGDAVEQKMRQDSSTDSDSMHSVLSMGNFRQDDSSIDSLDRLFHYTGDMDSSPQMLKSSHLSPSNLSGDSGLCDEDGNGNEIMNDRRQYSRSNSHFIDRDIERQDSEGTSRSLDNHYFYMEGGHNPVPPPRKSRRKGPDQLQNLSPNLENFRKNSKYVSQSNNGSSGKYDKRYSAEQYRQYYKRRSSESLKSVEESSEADSEVNVKDWRSKGDMGTLIKSASGAHLFYDDMNSQSMYEFDTMNGNSNSKGRMRLNNRSTPLSPQSKYSLSSSHDSVLSDSSGSFLNRQYSPDPLSSPVETPDNEDQTMNDWLTQQSKQSAFANTRQRHYSHDDSQVGLKSEDVNSQHESSSFVSPKTSPRIVKRAPLPNHSPVNVRYSFPMQHRTSPVGSGSNTSKEAEDIIKSPKISVHYASQESLEQPDPTPQKNKKAPHLDLYNNNNSMMKQINMYSAGLQGSSPPPRVVLQALSANQGLEKRDSSKPMKAVHDSAIISQMRRNSVDTLEDSVSSESEESESESEEEVYRVTTVVKMKPFTYSIPQSLVKEKRTPVKQAKPTLTHLTTSTVQTPSPTKSVEESPSRPTNPPSYNEALQRTYMLRNGIPLEDESDEETVRQREASLKAKQLYEQSMRQYQEQRDKYGPPSQQFEQRLSVLGEKQEDVPSHEASESSSDEELVEKSPEIPRPEKDPKKLYEESLKRYQDEIVKSSTPPLVKTSSQEEAFSPTKGGDISNKNLLRISSLQRSCSDVGDSRYRREAFLNRRSPNTGSSPSRGSSSRDSTPTSLESTPTSRESTPTKRPDHPPPYDAPPPYRKGQSGSSPASTDHHQFPRAGHYIGQHEAETKDIQTNTNGSVPANRSVPVLHSRESSSDSHSSSVSHSGQEAKRVQNNSTRSVYSDSRAIREPTRHRIAVSAAQNPSRDTNRSVRREPIKSNKDLLVHSQASSVESSKSTDSSSSYQTNAQVNAKPTPKHLSASVFRPRASSADKHSQPTSRSATEVSPVRASSAPQSSQQPVRSREVVAARYREFRRSSLDSRSDIDARVTRNSLMPKKGADELPWSVKRLSNLFDGQSSPQGELVTRSASASPARPIIPPPYTPPPPFQKRNDNSRSSTSSNSSVNSAGTGRSVPLSKRTYKYGPQARDSFSSADSSECSCRYSLSCQRDNSSLEELDQLSFTDISYV